MLRKALPFLAGATLSILSLGVSLAQTINIGPNQYAFRYTTNPNYGLFFNATNVAYDFRNGSAAPIWSINADNGQLRNDLLFAPGFTYRIPAGNWALRSATAPNAGIFFGATDFEFRIASGAVGIGMNALTGNVNFIGTITAPGGNSTNWNTAFSWGNHAGLYKAASYVPTWAEISGKPTTLAGYGITNAMSTAHPANAITNTNITNWNTAFGWGNHAGLYKAASYVPTWAEISGKPTTLAGYGITNAMSTAHPANAITNTNITNWNTAFGWGNHAGLYKAASYVPTWAEISGKPTTLAGYGITNAMSTAHPANAITNTNITNWNTAFGWGNHATAGYVTQTGLASNSVPRWTGSQMGVSPINASATAVGINSAPVSTNNLNVVRDLAGGRAISADVTFSGNNDVRAVYGNSVTNPGWGIGGEFIGGFKGVIARANSSEYSGETRALEAIASGTTGAGARIAVYGSAFGGSTNWAGYFIGNEYISGDLLVGTLNGATGYKVSVNGKIMCTELRVLAVANWPDYVFGDSHKRLSLDELGTFVKTEKHLPGVPSAAEMEAAQGFEVGEMQKITIEKVEELTLYILEQHERIKAQDEAAKEQEARLKEQEARLKKQEQDIENLKALVQQLLND